NLISPVEMDFVLMRIFANAAASAQYDFDHLFIPFRCITADIDSNRRVIMSSGDLDKAIRASLTFPFYYKPIKINGRLLFDGGMYNNFPVDVVQQEFQPDVIIGSKVAGNYPKSDPDDIISQIQNMLTVNTDFSIDSAMGVLIEPPVKKVNLVDFSTAADFIDSGYAETFTYMSRIKELVKRRVNIAALDSARMIFNSRKPPYLIDSIHISGLSDREEVYVYRTLIHKRDNPTLSDITPEYFKLAADNKLKLDGSAIRFKPATGKYDLYLELKPADRFTLKFGGNISSRLANQAFVEINYKYLFRDALNLKANVYFGRFYTSALLGLRLDVPARFPYYAGGQLVYNHYDYFKSTIHFFEDLTPSFLIQDDNYFGVYAGIPVTNKGRLQADYRLGFLEDKYYQNNLFSREDTADQTEFQFMSGKLLWELNSLNRKQYADAGARFLISATYVNGLEKFTSGSLSEQAGSAYEKSHQWLNFKLLWDNYFERIGPVQLGFYSELNVSTQEFFNNYTSGLLAAPSFNPLPESKTVFLPKFRAHSYGAIGLKTVVGLSKRIDFRAETYLFQPYREMIRDENNKSVYGDPFEERNWMAAGTLVYHTFIGPLSLSVNYFENPEEKFFVALNIGYIIFNKRALE
ncbi:MAG: patatin-like phospholipase family protein, partial [Bacteroidota bacterium]